MFLTLLTSHLFVISSSCPTSLRDHHPSLNHIFDFVNLSLFHCILLFHLLVLHPFAITICCSTSCKTIANESKTVLLSWPLFSHTFPVSLTLIYSILSCLSLTSRFIHALTFSTSPAMLARQLKMQPFMRSSTLSCMVRV